MVVSNKDAQLGNEYDHEVAKIESTDSGWTVEITEPDGTFIAKAGVDRAGVVQYWQLPFGCVYQREEELIAKSGWAAINSLNPRISS